jgi:hypothetical protein
MRGKRIEANWQGIRDSIVAGMTYREVSKRFSVPSACIRKRASREKWPTPTAIQETIEAFKAKQHALIQKDAQPIATSQDRAERCFSDGQSLPMSQVSHRAVSQLESQTTTTAEIIGQQWVEKGEVHRRLAFDLATKALQSLQNDRVGVPPLEQWSDIEKADKIARRAAGLEESTVPETVNVRLALVNQRILAMQKS